MLHTRSRAVGPIVWLTLALVMGLLALVYFGRDPQVTTTGTVGDTPAPVQATNRSAKVELDLAQEVDVSAPAVGRTEAPTLIPSISEKSSDAQESGATRATTEVQILIDENPWLAGNVSNGTLTWGQTEDQVDDYRIRFESPSRGAVALPAPPTATDEFGEMTIEGLALKIDALEVLEPPGGKVYRLQASFKAGATLVWAGNAPSRPPVNVAVGGGLEPPSRKAFSHGNRHGLVESRSGMELPLTLPRLVSQEPVWVGAHGLRWRSFLVDPEAKVVEVQLSPAAAVKVLHDPPAAGETLFVFTTAYPKGTTDSKPFTDGTPVAFTERPATAHEVWITNKDNRKAPPLSRRARLDLVAGETAVVDLTATYADQHLGGLRVRIRGSAETIKLAKGKIVPSIQRRNEDGVTPAWERAGNLMKAATDLAGSGPPDPLTFEAVGLEPLLHRVNVAPFGASATCRVVAGETQIMEIDLDESGWVQFVYPEDYDVRGGGFAYLITQTPDPADRVYVSVRTGRETRFPVATGTYIAEQGTFSESPDHPPLASDPFVVQRGVTTEVVLKPRPPMVVEVEARDAITNEPIALDLNFWVDLSAIESASAKSLVRSTSFHGAGDAYRGIQWQLMHTSALAKIVIPDSPFWTFEDLDPFELEHQSTIVLRANAKK